MINNLQVLRAMAVLNVVLYHTFGVGESYGYRPRDVGYLTEWGANGVDLFFVISGFVMYFIHHSNPKPPLEFMKNRVKRIVPLYWSVTLGCLALILLIPSAFRQAVFDPFHAVSSLFFFSHLVGYRFPVLAPGWTLEFEMFFYLLFTLAIIRKKIDPFLPVSAMLCIAVFVAGLDEIALEFIFGMLAGYLYVNRYLSKAGPFFVLLGFLGLFASIFIKTDLNRLFVWGVPSFFLVLGSCYLRQVKKGLWVLLGSASYGIYLIHTMTLPIFYKVIKWSGLSNHGAMAVFSVGLCVVLSAVAGVMLYRFYERPLSKVI